jgi:hypothetical protein
MAMVSTLPYKCAWEKDSPTFSQYFTLLIGGRSLDHFPLFLRSVDDPRIFSVPDVSAV